MTFEPILTAPLMIQLHVLGVAVAVVLGPVALLRRSRDRVHKTAGYVWLASMVLAAVSSFWISGIRLLGPFGPIHVLSVMVLISVTRGLLAIRRGDVARHKAEMQSLYFWALGVAGLFTFLPGRRMNQMFFAEREVLGFVLVAVILGAGLAWYAAATRREDRGRSV